MPRQCTICTSELRPAIEMKLIAGESTTEIAKWATDNGLKLSHMTVQRHKQHIEGFEPDTGEQPGIDVDKVTGGVFMVEPPKFKDGTELLEFARDTARAIYANQLVIVRAKQEAFMQGRGRYPSAEIQALRTLVSCMGNITSGAESVYKDTEQNKQ